MCDLLERVKSEGEAKTLLNNIRKMMRNLNLTVEQAMTVLEVPKDKQAELKPLI